MTTRAGVEPMVAVCVGKDCAAAKGFVKLVEVAAQLPKPRQVPCQECCDGPVAGLLVNGKMRWFERIRRKELRAALVASVDERRVHELLTGREVRSRRGRFEHERQAKPLKRR
jgi:hypothetical protein